MAHDNTKSDSPPSSPITHEPHPRSSRLVADEETRRPDKNYRRYAAGIERALASFESPRQEWADYISFLGRLQKAVQAHPGAIDILPHRAAVAHRLSQCLSPALPSGVHQKAIELYSYIFSVIGRDSLARDFYIYLPGLTPVLSFASLTLRPAYLSLLETYVISLERSALRPALKALILSLLPGLEDETSEDFERTLQIVDNLKDAVKIAPVGSVGLGLTSGDEYFWQCLFLASVSSYSRRQGALAYLVRRLPKLVPVTDPAHGTVNGNGPDPNSNNQLSGEAESVLSPEPGLLIRCFTTGLCDEQILLQRGFLDLLLTHFPLNSPVLTHRVSSVDLEHLVGAAIGVVSRRDMSLNRRLWVWLLGPQANDDDPESPETTAPSAKENHGTARQINAASYFAQHGLKPLVNYLLNLIKRGDANLVARARPFRISLSLMDRAEVGELIVPKIFIPAIDNLCSFQSKATEDDFREVLKSASSFFDGIESGIIWGELDRMIVSALSSGSLENYDRQRRLVLVKFVLEHFNVREEEMLTFHMPLAATLCASMINRWVNEHSKANTTVTETSELALAVLDKFVNMMPERAHLNSSFGESSLDDKQNFDNEMILEKIQKFYTKHKGNLSLSPPPFSSRTTADLLLIIVASTLRQSFAEGAHVQTQLPEARILATLIPKMPDCNALDFKELIFVFQKAVKPDPDPKAAQVGLPFPALTMIINTVTQWISTQGHAKELLTTNLNDLVVGLVEATWTYLSPSFPKYHLEAVRALWQLDDLTVDSRIVEASIATFIGRIDQSDKTGHTKIEFAKRFSVLWTHTSRSQGVHARKNAILSRRGSTMSSSLASTDSKDHQSLHRPLMLLLESLTDDESEFHYFVSGWLQSLKNIGVVIEVVFLRILKSTAPAVTVVGEKERAGLLAQIRHENETPERLYYFQHLLNLCKLSSDNVWNALNKDPELLKPEEIEGEEGEKLQTVIVHHCFQVIRARSTPNGLVSMEQESELKHVALAIILHLLQGPSSNAIQDLAMTDTLVDILGDSLTELQTNTSLRIALLDAILASLKLDALLSPHPAERPTAAHSRSFSTDTPKARPRTPRISTPSEEVKSSQTSLVGKQPPKQLLKCIEDGIASTTSYHMLDSWINFLIEVLPLYADTLFQNLISVVECLCKQIKTLFQQLNGVFSNWNTINLNAPEPAIIALLSGVEYVLTTAHDRLTIEEQRKTVSKSPEQPQGFFGNVVSGVFSSEAQQKGRSATANTRLTVLLCFQDAVQICLSLYSWAYEPGGSKQDSNSLGSFNYVSTRLRNKARRILDRIFAVEPLECLETLIVSWIHQRHITTESSPSPILNLLHVLDSSRPKVTMPAIFNAIYSRTNPSALEANRTSTLTADLTDVELGHFLIDYISSLDADAMDEIWTDCVSFLREILANPLPHSQVLPSLLLFIVILAEKISNTNFGEQRRMKKELADLFMRLLTATFTARSVSSQQDGGLDGKELSNGEVGKARAPSRKSRYSDMVDTLVICVPRLSAVLSETDKLAGAVTSISTHLVSPAMHSKNFPENIRQNLLSLVQKLTKASQSSKAWRKDVADAFNHQKFFSCPVSLVPEGWLPTLRQWALVEKDRISELLSRVPAPTSAGMLFGVGANTARLEADKKAQVNLRRIAVLILAQDTDSIVSSMPSLEEKLIEIFTATGSSSPSSFTRADAYMLLRSIVLRTSSIHLAPLWPLITSELQKALSSALPRSNDYDTYNTYSLLQACKLLDLLLLSAPEDFQMHAWLFITDTIDAVYRPTDVDAAGLVDEIAEELGSSLSATAATPSTFSPSTPFPTDSPIAPTGGAAPAPRTPTTSTTSNAPQKAVLLDIKSATADMPKDDFAKRVLRPFFSQLSISAFETAYRMGEVDWKGCEEALLRDLFDDGTFVGVKG